MPLELDGALHAVAGGRQIDIEAGRQFWSFQPLQRIERYYVNWGMQADPDDSGVYNTLLDGKAYPTDEHPYGTRRVGSLRMGVRNVQDDGCGQQNAQ